MTESHREVELLSRDELDALLAEASAAVDAGASSSRLAEPFRRDPERGEEGAGERAPQLRKAVEQAAAGLGQRLASRHQRRIQCSLIGWEELEIGALRELLHPGDRLVEFTALPTSARGFVLVARPLAFALLTLEFGGRRVSDQPVPVRDYTRIERRFLRRVAGEVVDGLQASWRDWSSVEASVSRVAAPEQLAEGAPSTLTVATLDVTGLGPVGRLRVGLPEAPFQFVKREPAAGPARGAGAIGRSLHDLQLTLRVELGSTELSLARLGELQPGDVIPIERAVPDGFLVRVEGRPKFRATRGAVGGRLAVQVRERIEGLGSDR